jgi:pantothenate synthetase
MEMRRGLYGYAFTKFINKHQFKTMDDLTRFFKELKEDKSDATLRTTTMVIAATTIEALIKRYMHELVFITIKSEYFKKEKRGLRDLFLQRKS